MEIRMHQAAFLWKPPRPGLPRPLKINLWKHGGAPAEFASLYGTTKARNRGYAPVTGVLRHWKILATIFPLFADQGVRDGTSKPDIARPLLVRF